MPTNLAQGLLIIIALLAGNMIPLTPVQMCIRDSAGTMARAGGADPSPGGAEEGGECANGLQNGSQYHPHQPVYLNAIRVSVRYIAPASFTLLN